MKNHIILCIMLLLSLDCAASSSAITWCRNEGRFGDQLVSYSRAQWLAYKYNIPLLYVPFNYSDQLMLHEKTNIFTKESKKLFPNIVHLPTQLNFDLLPDNNTLYVSYWKIETDIDWSNQGFVDTLRETIASRYPVQTITPPEGYVSIAVHVRNGGTFLSDTDAKRELCPLRFAPEEFFIDQIARLADMFENQKLYVYIFTDHKNPAYLQKKFKNALNNPRIKFDCRRQDNSHSSNVLEDFFSMMNFDCLVRPASNFSKFVQYVGYNKIVIFPSSSHKNAEGTRVIDTISIHTRDAGCYEWKTEKITI